MVFGNWPSLTSAVVPTTHGSSKSNSNASVLAVVEVVRKESSSLQDHQDDLLQVLSRSQEGFEVDLHNPSSANYSCSSNSEGDSDDDDTREDSATTTSSRHGRRDDSSFRLSHDDSGSGGVGLGITRYQKSMEEYEARVDHDNDDDDDIPLSRSQVSFDESKNQVFQVPSREEMRQSYRQERIEVRQKLKEQMEKRKQENAAKQREIERAKQKQLELKLAKEMAAKKLAKQLMEKEAERRAHEIWARKKAEEEAAAKREQELEAQKKAKHLTEVEAEQKGRELEAIMIVEELAKEEEDKKARELAKKKAKELANHALIQALKKVDTPKSKRSTCSGSVQKAGAESTDSSMVSPLKTSSKKAHAEKKEIFASAKSIAEAAMLVKLRKVENEASETSETKSTGGDVFPNESTSVKSLTKLESVAKAPTSDASIRSKSNSVKAQVPKDKDQQVDEHTQQSKLGDSLTDQQADDHSQRSKPEDSPEMELQRLLSIVSESSTRQVILEKKSSTPKLESDAESVNKKTAQPADDTTKGNEKSREQISEIESVSVKKTETFDEAVERVKSMTEKEIASLCSKSRSSKVSKAMNTQEKKAEEEDVKDKKVDKPYGDAEVEVTLDEALSYTESFGGKMTITNEKTRKIIEKARDLRKRKKLVELQQKIKEEEARRKAEEYERQMREIMDIKLREAAQMRELAHSDYDDDALSRGLFSLDSVDESFYNEKVEEVYDRAAVDLELARERHRVNETVRPDSKTNLVVSKKDKRRFLKTASSPKSNPTTGPKDKPPVSPPNTKPPMPPKPALAVAPEVTTEKPLTKELSNPAPVSTPAPNVIKTKKAKGLKRLVRGIRGMLR